MRVVYLVSLFPCWSETFIVREIRELLKLNVDVRIVSLKPPSESLVQSEAITLLDRVVYPKSFLTNAWRVLTSIFRRPRLHVDVLRAIVAAHAHRPATLVKALVVWWRAVGLARDVQRLAPEHIHAHWATYPSTAALVISQMLRCPFSFTAHAHDIFLEDHLLARKLSQARFAVVISEYNRRYLSDYLASQDREKLQLIHCGVVLDQFPYRRDGREPRRILGIGRLDGIKGFSHLIEACALLAARNEPFECDIIGDGPLRSELEAQIHKLGIAEQVRLRRAMKQEELRKELYGAGVFVLPSVRTPTGNMDGIPVALMEAMAVGTPVISTRISGIPELVEHQHTGLLVPPGDARELAKQIEYMFENPEDAAALAERAREKVELEFDASKEARKLYEVFSGGRYVDRTAT